MLKNYTFENFDIDMNSSAMPIMVCAIGVGLILGILFSLIFRNVSARVIRALLEGGAVDESTARTLGELGIRAGFVTRFILKPNSPLFKAIGCVGGFSPKKAGKFTTFLYEKFLRDEIPAEFDYKSARFYLPEDKRVSAELRFKKEAHPVRSFIISTVLICLVCVFVIFALPELLVMLDNFVSSV